MKKHKHIIFAAEHYNPLGVVRSLGEYGIRPIGIILRSKKVFMSKSKYWDEVRIVDTPTEGYELLLKEYGNEEVKPFLYTCDDDRTSFLDERYEELKDKFIFFNAGEKGRISQFMNKDTINKLAMKHGLNVLDAVAVHKGEIPDGLTYPIITKSIASTVGGWKKDVHICRSKEELEKAYENIQAPVVLLQKYIEKKNELCIDGFCVERGKKCFFTIASNYTYLLPNTYSSQMRVFNLNNPELERKLCAMFEEVGFEGIFSVEFLVDQNDELYFCEINFRNSTWSYASTCAGMNLPVLWAKGMCGQLEDESVYKEIKENFIAVVEVNDFKDRVLGKRIGFFKWWRELRKADCKFYIGKKDRRPMRWLFWSALKRGK